MGTFLYRYITDGMLRWSARGRGFGFEVRRGVLGFGVGHGKSFPVLFCHFISVSVIW